MLEAEPEQLAPRRRDVLAQVGLQHVSQLARLHRLDLIPEDEAFNYDGRLEQYYIVRFRQKDLWEEYPFDNDTLQTEFPDRWLEPVSD